MKQFLVTLHHGFIFSNSHYRNASLRELNGYDEQFLDDIKNQLPIFLQSNELLKRLVSFGNIECNNDDIFKNLTIGDRITLLLNVRKITFGNILHCVAVCPLCKQKISIDVDIDNLIKTTNTSKISSASTINTKKFKIKIRPLKTVDQRSIFYHSDKKTSQLTEFLIRSCIISSKPDLPQRLPDSVLSLICTSLEKIDPLVDIILGLHCPSCQNDFQTPFDVEKFILEEIYLRDTELENDIHKIAFYYHWNEDTILSLSMKKRQRYVDLVDDTLSGMVQ